MFSMTSPLTTARLHLIATTIAHLDLEIDNAADSLGDALGAVVPQGWPPGFYDRDAMIFFRDRLREEGPESVGWYGWYAIRRATDDASALLVGAAGFMGPPRDGCAEIGYSVVESVRGQGFATEIVLGLVEHARLDPQITTFMAHTAVENVASQAVLRRAGFTYAGNGVEPGSSRYTRLAR
jgi:[ribosomal protein S5]-alanine N-acetyltransferase